MISKIKLGSNSNLYLGENNINKASYINVMFLGGRAVQKCPQLAHLCEHILIGFDRIVQGKLKKCEYMGSMKADARTQDTFLEFHFITQDIEQLRDKLLELSNQIKYVNITQSALDREKRIIEEELISYGTINEQDFKEFKKSLDAITIEDCINYIRDNITANNLQIIMLNNLRKEEVVDILKKFHESLPTSNKNNKYAPQKEVSIEIASQDDGDVMSLANIEAVCELSTIDKKDDVKLDILNSYLQNFRVGIKRNLRHELGLVYRTTAGIRGDNTLFVTAKTREENLELVAEKIEEYFNNLRDNGISQEDFELVRFNRDFLMCIRPNIIGANALRKIHKDYVTIGDQDADSKILNELKQSNINAIEYWTNWKNDNLVEYLDRLNKITIDEMNTFINKYLSKGHFYIDVLSEQNLTTK